MKKGKSARVDNIPADPVQAAGETRIDVLTEIYNRIWRTGEWRTPWAQSLIIMLSIKGNLHLTRTTELLASSAIRTKPCLESS